MNTRLSGLAVLIVIVVLLTSCQNTQHVVSRSSATLSNILTITRPNTMDASVDYLYLLKTPEFNPDTFSYSVTVDSSYLLGIQPVPTSSEAIYSVTIDNKQLSSMQWNSETYFSSYKYESGKTNITIKIKVINNDESNVYTVAVHYDGAGNNVSKDLLISNFSFSLPEIVLWDSMGEGDCYGRYGSYKCTIRVGNKIVKPTPELLTDVFNYTLNVGNYNYLGFEYSWMRNCESGNIMNIVYSTSLGSDTLLLGNNISNAHFLYYTKLQNTARGVDTVRMFLKCCGDTASAANAECETGPVYTFLLRK